MNPKIIVGSRVAFDSDQGIQSGTVTALMADLGNGQRHAIIAIDHQHGGIVTTMPVAALQTSHTTTDRSLK